jgi:hypothetical protein
MDSLGQQRIQVFGVALPQCYTPEGGTIALQAHDANSTVYYKNIRIKPLK